jgi:hypothetical protein
VFAVKLAPGLRVNMARMNLPTTDAVCRWMIGNMASFCAWAAVLLLCSGPTRRASSTSYPTTLFRDSFVRYAGQVELMEPLERLSIYNELKGHPFEEMERLGIFVPEILRDFTAANRKLFEIGAAGKTSTETMWTDWFPRKALRDVIVGGIEAAFIDGLLSHEPQSKQVRPSARADKKKG